MEILKSLWMDCHSAPHVTQCDWLGSMCASSLSPRLSAYLRRVFVCRVREDFPEGRRQDWALSWTLPSGLLQSSLVTRTEGLDQQVDWNW